MATPTENGIRLDQFNDALRQSPGWQAFMRRNGIPLDGSPIQLSGGQREALKQELLRAGVPFPDGMQIDPAGNVNQDQGVSRAWNNPWIKWPAIAGGALATMGALGFGPLAGVLGGGGGGSATLGGITAGTLPSGAAAPLVSVGAPAASLASGGASAGLSAIPGIAAGTLPGGAAAPVGAVGGAWAAPTIPGIAAGTLPGGGRAPNVTPSVPPGNSTPGLGQMTPGAPTSGRGFNPGSLASKLTDPSSLAQLASIIPALVSAGAGGGSGGSGAGNNSQLDALIKMAADRAQRTDPLHQMVTRLAESRMPINSRNV